MQPVRDDATDDGVYQSSSLPGSRDVVDLRHGVFAEVLEPEVEVAISPGEGTIEARAR